MIRITRIALCCGLLVPLHAAAEEKPISWTNDRLIAKVLSLAEKLQDEYAKEKDAASEKDKDSETWRALDYYADKLRNRLFVRSRDKNLGAQKASDLQWLARESDERSYAMRHRETAKKSLKELKILLSEIKEQLKTNEELPRGAAFQLKALVAEGAMRPMQEVWKPPKGEGVDE